MIKKNNILKLFLLLIVICIYTGCTVNANVTVNDDFTANEIVSIYFDNSLVSKYQTPKQYAENYISYYKNAIYMKEYKYNIVSGDETSHVDFTKKYNNICDGIKNNLFITSLYERVQCNETDTNIIIKSIGDNLIAVPASKKKFNVESLTLTITLPIKAEDDNADAVSDKTYTWKYDADSKGKDFYISIRKKDIEEHLVEVKQNKKKQQVIGTIKIAIGIVVVLAILGIVAYFLYKQYKKNMIEY